MKKITTLLAFLLSVNANADDTTHPVHVTLYMSKNACAYLVDNSTGATQFKEPVDVPYNLFAYNIGRDGDTQVRAQGDFTCYGATSTNQNGVLGYLPLQYAYTYAYGRCDDKKSNTLTSTISGAETRTIFEQKGFIINTDKTYMPPNPAFNLAPWQFLSAGQVWVMAGCTNYDNIKINYANIIINFTKES
jgi:hypothetical protein